MDLPLSREEEMEFDILEAMVNKLYEAIFGPLPISKMAEDALELLEEIPVRDQVDDTQEHENMVEGVLAYEDAPQVFDVIPERDQGTDDLVKEPTELWEKSENGVEETLVPENAPQLCDGMLEELVPLVEADLGFHTWTTPLSDGVYSLPYRDLSALDTIECVGGIPEKELVSWTAWSNSPMRELEGLYAKLDKSNGHDIALVGGSSGMLRVQDWKQELNPDTMPWRSDSLTTGGMLRRNCTFESEALEPTSMSIQFQIAATIIDNYPVIVDCVVPYPCGDLFASGTIAEFATVRHQIEVLEDRMEEKVQPVHVIQVMFAGHHNELELAGSTWKHIVNGTWIYMIHMYGWIDMSLQSHPVIAVMDRRGEFYWKNWFMFSYCRTPQMIGGYDQNGDGNMALSLDKKWASGYKPTSSTFACVWTAYVDVLDIILSTKFHSQFVKAEILCNGYVSTSLVTMYIYCKQIEDSGPWCGERGHTDVTSWTALNSGCSMGSLVALQAQDIGGADKATTIDSSVLILGAATTYSCMDLAPETEGHVHDKPIENLEIERITKSRGATQKALTVDLTQNKLYKSLSADVCYGKALQEIYIHTSSFTGFVTDSIGKCSNLKTIQIQDIGFHREFPMGLWSLLEGDLRVNCCDSVVFSIIDLAHNSLSGAILELRKGRRLVSLSLVDNSFTGYITSNATVQEGVAAGISLMCAWTRKVQLDETNSLFHPISNLEGLLTCTSVIQNWVPISLPQEMQVGLEADYGASIDQFFECCDEFRSAQTTLGNSRIWHWTSSSPLSICKIISSGKRSYHETDNKGEGSMFALYSILCQQARLCILPNHQASDKDWPPYDVEGTSRLWYSSMLKEFVTQHRKGLLVVVLLGTCMTIGNHVLAPTILVLSTVTIAYAILVVLFSLRLHGTHRIGFILAPIVTAWLLSISGISQINIFRWDPIVFHALSWRGVLYITDIQCHEETSRQASWPRLIASFIESEEEHYAMAYASLLASGGKLALRFQVKQGREISGSMSLLWYSVSEAWHRKHQLDLAGHQAYFPL